jgi:hypothetical protein
MINHEWGKDREVFETSGTFVTQIFFLYFWNTVKLILFICLLVDSHFSLSPISGRVKFLSKSRTSLCINIHVYNLTPVELNSDESKFRLSRIKVLVLRCRKPYYLHSLSRIYLSKHVYYLGITIGSQVKHLVIDFNIFTLGHFTCLFQSVKLIIIGYYTVLCTIWKDIVQVCIVHNTV